MEEIGKKNMRNGLIFTTPLLIVLLIFFWVNPLSGIETFKLKEQIMYTVLIIIGLIGGWIFYFHQKKLDKTQDLSKQNTIKEKVFRGTNILDGIGLKIGSFKWVVVGILFFFGGIYIIISTPQYWWLGILLIVLSFLLIIVVKTFWKLGGRKLKGKYY